MVFINDTGTIGIFITTATTNLTGNIELTILMMIIGIFAFMLSLKIAPEYAIPIMIPLLSVSIITYAGIVPFLIIALIITTAIITKHFIL